MNEITRKFLEVLSEQRLDDLRHRCNYYEDDEFNEFYFKGNDFINGYSIVEYGYGEEDFQFGEHKSNIIDTNGFFVEIELNNEIKYMNGDIIKLNEADKGSYSFDVHRIQELFYKFHPFKGYVIESTKDTAYFYIKVTRFSYKEETVDLYFVINSDLKVIASFTDADTWGIEYDGYHNCNVYTERRFFFINEERKFLVFSQKQMVNCNDNGFFEEHMYGLAPDLYRDQMQEFGCYDDWDEENSTIYEYELDEETLSKIMNKSNHSSVYNDVNEDDEDDDTPELEDITFFYDDINNKHYKNVFTEYYRELFGIIDCRITAKKQLTPFTDNIDYVIGIIWERWRCEKEINESGHFRYYSNGWDFKNNRFYGYVMSNKFFDYPSCVAGFTLRYVMEYYPSILKKLVEQEIILVPNRLLNKLGDNELIRFIRIEQEQHLNYAPIHSVDDTIKSDEKYGLISSYQGQTLRQIIYSKGGTKHIVKLIKFTNLNIDKDVIKEYINNSNNKIETNCFNILLSVLEDIEYQQEEYNSWVREKMEEDMIRDANRQFDEMMDDFDAWGNID